MEKKKPIGCQGAQGIRSSESNSQARGAERAGSLPRGSRQSSREGSFWVGIHNMGHMRPPPKKKTHSPGAAGPARSGPGRFPPGQVTVGRGPRRRAPASPLPPRRCRRRRQHPAQQPARAAPFPPPSSPPPRPLPPPPDSGAMSTAPRRLLRTLVSSTFRMGDSASRLPRREEALPGRSQRIQVAGKTGHTEAVRVVYQPENISFEKLLKVFWENHDPTQGMRQGNDFGTQYRSAIYTFSEEQMEAALRSKEDYQKILTEGGFGTITTEIREASEFYYAEDYHQQYLSKNPDGYCGLGGTGLSCPIRINK
ncbi:mitochondrial peptide methionine sulfoxide reductase isoform X5 [Struthio camelus]|uniref:mitochondrial peptide methionine sulfoxide reductase isoform X5 n=1 Tax=Struthio camelus TaxID=8801 RepID=UPI00360403A1